MIDDDSTDDLESGIGDVETAVEGLETAIRRVEVAVARVENAINNKWSTAQWVIIIFLGAFLWSWLGTVWHAKWRYAVTYNIPSSQIYVQDQPNDCAFLAAPMGEKYCHYERTVSVTRWAKSQSGNPIISYDDGQTWSPFDPAPETAPQYSTVKAVYIGWEKKED